MSLKRKALRAAMLSVLFMTISLLPGDIPEELTALVGIMTGPLVNTTITTVILLINIPAAYAPMILKIKSYQLFLQIQNSGQA